MPITRTVHYYLSALTLCFCHVTVIAQQSKTDSLLVLLKSAPADTNKLNYLNSLSEKYYDADAYDSSLYYANAALELCKVLLKETKDEKIKQTTYIDQALAHTNIGLVYKEQGNYPAALKNHQACLQIRETFLSHNKSGIASAHNNIGNIYYNQGNYPEALRNHFASLKIREAIDDKKGMAASYNNIGIIYADQANTVEALKNYLKALKINEATGNQRWIAINHNNIGLIYSGQGNYPEALKNYQASLKIKQALGDKKGIAYCYNNLGVVYFAQGDYSESLKNYFAALEINEAIGHKPGFADSYINIALTLTKQKEYKEAREYLIKAVKVSTEIGDKESLRNTYDALADVDSASGNFRAAYEDHKLFISYRDSLDNEESRTKTIESQMTFDFEKKEAVAEAEHKKELENQQALAAEKSRKQKFVIIFILVGLLAVLLAAGFILRSLRLTRKQKQIIEFKSRETEEQKMIIEEKNKDITSSITYAKRIQQAILPNLDEIKSALPQSFILYKPKDIVSGDFYFFRKKDKTVFIAAADCTGHGVPGAFMSVIGSERLNDAVSQSSDLSQILSLLNKGIKSSLKQSASDESTRDGMDIALCSIDAINHNITYAGAYRPLFVIRNGNAEVEEIKATKKAIGGLTEDTQHFDSHILQLQKGDTFYVCTDGYADQFGNSGKKLMTGNLKKILLGIQDQTMAEQEKYLDNLMENWRAGIEQIDDILIIGVRM